MKSLEKSEYFRLKRLCIRFKDLINEYEFYQNGAYTQNVLIKDITGEYAIKCIYYEKLIKTIINCSKIAREGILVNSFRSGHYLDKLS